jgi:hypothetical protein
VLIDRAASSGAANDLSAIRALPPGREQRHARMPVPMPSKVGDVVITHVLGARSSYLVWVVIRDGQREPGDVAAEASELMDAMTEARRLAARSGGAIFLLEQESGLWTPLSGPNPV